VLFTVPRYVTTGGSGKIIRKGRKRTKMASSILPSKFDGDDIVAWQREFDACALANGWNSLGKTRTNLRNCQRFYERFFCQRFFYFFATPVAERTTYDAVTKKLRQSPVSAS
jgi:hypothetical protein